MRRCKIQIPAPSNFHGTARWDAMQMHWTKALHFLQALVHTMVAFSARILLCFRWHGSISLSLPQTLSISFDLHLEMTSLVFWIWSHGLGKVKYSKQNSCLRISKQDLLICTRDLAFLSNWSSLPAKHCYDKLVVLLVLWYILQQSHTLFP